ncbi:small s protein [Colletotrichum abscissum]|uniref:Small s protein n=1 Tax=Colletotrichum abscissum TaxID=1671311 RepID=A0A9P9X2G5_9PEZI|nr:small s protein [Colletotrichum abscissum]
MTGVVEGIGAASGLAGLFNTAITWFDYVLVAKQAAPRLQSLLVKLDDAQLRMTRWGKAAGLTGLRIEDDDSLKSSDAFQLDDEQEEQAIRTFSTVAALFEECQKLCHRERKGRSEDDPSVQENEINPFGAAGPNWNPMHRYLHGKMRDIIDGRRNKVPVTQRVKFAIYKKEHLEKFIKDINDHIDALYRIYNPPVEEQDALGKAELVELLQVVKELGLAAERDSVIHSAVQNILELKPPAPAQIMRPISAVIADELIKERLLQDAATSSPEAPPGPSSRCSSSRPYPVIRDTTVPATSTSRHGMHFV